MSDNENTKNADIGVAAALSFHPTQQQVTRRVPDSAPKSYVDFLWNPNPSEEQRLLILQQDYPDAPGKLLEVIAKYKTLRNFIRAIHAIEPIQSAGTSENNTGVQLSAILTGKFSGWNSQGEPNKIIQAAANLTRLPVDDFVPVLDDGDRLDDLRRHYPKANDALLQVIVPFKICRNFAKQLLEVDPFKSKGIKLGNVCVNLYDTLTINYKSDLQRKIEPDGTRKPKDIIIAVAAFTGLDHRYFLRREDGGIPLKPRQRIAYDQETGTYSIVSTAPKLAPRFAAPVA